MLLPGLDLHCAGSLAFWGVSQQLPAKYRRRPSKVLPSKLVNPVLVIGLRS